MLIGLVFVDSRRINEEILREGLAWHRANARYRNVLFDKDVDARLRRASEEARSKRRGLWQQPDPQSPWEYRQASSGEDMKKSKKSKKSKKGKRFCPSCKSEQVIPIVYGYPGKELFEDAEKGRVELGGCVVDSHNPDWKCRVCKHAW